MYIDDYSFGRMVIDGVEYAQDVLILPGTVHKNWRRSEGHLLQMEDLATLVQRPPQALIIGKGYAGFMQVPSELVAELESKGITVHVSSSKQAVALYNQLAATTGNLAAAIHLTC